MKVFLSYQVEDAAFRENFSREVIDIEPAVIFRDYQKVDSFDPEWQQRCTEIIKECNGTVVLVGHTTYQSTPVAWEIAETKRQGLPAMGVILRGVGRPRTPDGLSYEDLVPAADAAVVQIRSWGAWRNSSWP